MEYRWIFPKEVVSFRPINLIRPGSISRLNTQDSLDAISSTLTGTEPQSLIAYHCSVSISNVWFTHHRDLLCLWFKSDLPSHWSNLNPCVVSPQPFNFSFPPFYIETEEREDGRRGVRVKMRNKKRGWEFWQRVILSSIFRKRMWRIKQTRRRVRPRHVSFSIDLVSEYQRQSFCEIWHWDLH